MAIFSLLAISSVALVFWVIFSYFSLTVAVAKNGGEYVEGIVGQPLYVNPLLSQTSQADADLSQLVYSGLLKYDGLGGLVPDAADRYEVSDDKKKYAVYLKDDVYWHDGEKMDAEDVFFTIKTIQDPVYRSPLRQYWQGVEVEMKDNRTVEFLLTKPYFGFLDNLTVGILPKHLWEKVAAENFALAELNRQPIGSGPYMFDDFEKNINGGISSYRLKAFPRYHQGRAHIPKMNFNFYTDEASMIEAYNKKEISGMNGLAPANLAAVNGSNKTQVVTSDVPRYFSVFFNQTKSIPLGFDEVRKALSYATDREGIVERVLSGQGTAIYSMFLPQMGVVSGDEKPYEFNPEEANSLLDNNGWERGEDGTRQKDGVRLGFVLYTTDWREMMETAEILREQWSVIGADVEIRILGVSDLHQNHIRPRDYDAVLTGQTLSFNPDPYSFWHSSQKKDPGLNLTLFDKDQVDTLLQEARQELDKEARLDKLRQFNRIVIDEAPAVFIYSPLYQYPINKKVQGVDFAHLNQPAHRFSDAYEWYIKTKRIYKNSFSSESE